MSLINEEFYKKIKIIKDVIKLKLTYSDKVQEQILEECLNTISPDQPYKESVLVFKFCLHLHSHGATETIKYDAFTCLTMIKSFSIKQNKDDLQYFCLAQFITLLYSRHITLEQQEECIHEINEFSKSENITILLHFTQFYFDTELNPTFNIFERPSENFNNKNLPIICKIITYMILNNINQLPQLFSHQKALTTETMIQRFFNQYVYGRRGLQSNTYIQKNNQLIIDSLIKISQSKESSSNQAKKAIIKHLTYLKGQADSSESTNNIDKLIRCKEELDYIQEHCTNINFEKLKEKYNKLIEDIQKKV